MAINKLKLARMNAGMTQGELAEKVECSPTYISDLERGHRKPSDVMTEKLAKALNVKKTEI